jgi:hypothetical protein
MTSTQKIEPYDFDYVWEYYNTENGFYKAFFSKTGLTEQEVLIAMRVVLDSEVYHGSFDTFCRELTRDILYYMKGVKMHDDDIFGGKLEYQHYIDKLFGLN